jgi:hypothetical protein
MRTITLDRRYRPAHGLYSIGHLYDADGKYICDTIEDTDRGLTSDMNLADILKVKVKSKTAIPRGRYRVTLDVVSPKFSLKPYYKAFCSGKVPKLLDVPGFDGILMHKGVSEKSSAGCIILGYNTVKGMVTNSQAAFEKVYRLLQSYKAQGHKIYIQIK